MKYSSLNVYRTLLNFYKNKFNANTPERIEWKNMMLCNLKESIEDILKEERIDASLNDQLDLDLE
jgi:hypothetical protein